MGDMNGGPGSASYRYEGRSPFMDRAPMSRQPGQGFGMQPGANGPAGWAQPQTSAWSSQGPQVRGGDTMRGGSGGMGAAQGDPYGAFIQQLQQQMSPNQQMAAQYGGRLGLGNPFNSPYAGMRQHGPSYGMGQNYAPQGLSPFGPSPQMGPNGFRGQPQSGGMPK